MGRGRGGRSRIGVGIIGISASRGWGATVHMPALRGLPDYEVVALATTRQSSADEAAQHFEVPLAFGDAQRLIEHPDVQLVSVCVKVPGHHELVMAALRAGKHVYCEWPLGMSVDEAVEMRDLAQSRNLRHMVGLQARGMPAIRYASDLVAQGHIGEVLSCTMLSVVPRWGLAMDTPNAYTLEQRNRANILTVAGGHSLDMLCDVLGEFEELSATLAVRRPRATLSDSGKEIAVSSPDHVALNGRLRNGAVASVHIQGGAVHATKFLFEINGSTGSLVLSDRGPLSAQMAPLMLMGASSLDASLAEMPVPAHYRRVPTTVPDGPTFNVGQLYAGLADAFRAGQSVAPDFGTAVTRHRLIEAIEQSARTGVRQNPGTREGN